MRLLMVLLVACDSGSLVVDEVDGTDTNAVADTHTETDTTDPDPEDTDVGIRPSGLDAKPPIGWPTGSSSRATSTAPETTTPTTNKTPWRRWPEGPTT